MTTRLNQNLRDTIIKNVLLATNLEERRVELVASIKADAQAMIKNSQPAGWAEVVKGRPPSWFKQQNNLVIDREFNPFRLLEEGHWYNQIALDDPVLIAEEICLDKPQSEVHFGASFLAAQQWEQDRERVKGELRAFLQSCRTVEEVVERMPEIAKHVPKHSAPMPLVAPSNLLSGLAALGFDRTERVVA